MPCQQVHRRPPCCRKVTASDSVVLSQRGVHLLLRARLPPIRGWRRLNRSGSLQRCMAQLQLQRTKVRVSLQVPTPQGAKMRVNLQVSALPMHVGTARLWIWAISILEGAEVGRCDFLFLENETIARTGRTRMLWHPVARNLYIHTRSVTLQRGNL